MTEAKKLYVKTFGCQMNVYDSERMAEALGTQGYEQVDTADDADMILFNTCHIREKAAEKMYSDLGRLKPLHDAKPDLKIAVAGCVAQAEGEEILRRQPMVDLVVGPQTYHRLPAMMQAVGRGERVLDTDFPEEDKFTLLPKDRRPARGPAAFLTVQEGCDKFCSFCVVPYTRGAEVSRPADRLLGEARDLRRAASARSRCSARTSTPITAQGLTVVNGGWRAWCASWPGSMGLNGSATPPRIPTTWKMT